MLFELALILQSLIADGVGIKLGVFVCDMSDLEKMGKSNSFIRL
jgi:hypothetical protein